MWVCTGMRRFFLILAVCGTLATPARAQGPASVEQLDTDGWRQWTGLETAGPAGAALTGTGAAVFRYPDGPRGFYKHGFRVLNDGAADWEDRYGVRLEVELPDDRAAELTVAVRAAGANGTIGESSESRTALCGAGWHEVVLPWRAFGFEQARTSFLKYVKELAVTVRFADGSPGRAGLRNVCVIQAPAVAARADVCGRAVPVGRTAEYAVTLSNCTDRPQAVALSFVRRGWEAMQASVEPATVSLPPGGSGVCTVRVQVPEKIPPGGHEEQTSWPPPTATPRTRARCGSSPPPSCRIRTFYTPRRAGRKRAPRSGIIPGRKPRRTTTSSRLPNGTCRKSRAPRTTTRTTRWGRTSSPPKAARTR